MHYYGCISGSGKRRPEKNDYKFCLLSYRSKSSDNADVAYVDPFYPSFYGFIRDKEHWPSLDMQPKDYGLGKSPSAPEPKRLAKMGISGFSHKMT